MSLGRMVLPGGDRGRPQGERQLRIVDFYFDALTVEMPSSA